MAISEELRAQILRYFHVEHWWVGTIATQLGVHHSTVERVLRDSGVSRQRRRQRRASMLDDYVPFIIETLERFPTLTASRLYEMVRARGYCGGPDHFRHRVAELRPRRQAEAYLRRKRSIQDRLVYRASGGIVLDLQSGIGGVAFGHLIGREVPRQEGFDIG